jgi:quercetin dioxygenase-like cupin family protein
VKRFDFRAESALTVPDALLAGVTIAPLTPPMAAGAPVQAAIFRIAPDGGIRRHPATVPQILAVLDGNGEVSGEGDVFEFVTAGDAVYFAAGESHETKTTEGLTVLIIECPGLEAVRVAGR